MKNTPASYFVYSSSLSETNIQTHSCILRVYQSVYLRCPFHTMHTIFTRSVSKLLFIPCNRSAVGFAIHWICEIVTICFDYYYRCLLIVDSSLLQFRLYIFFLLLFSFRIFLLISLLFICELFSLFVAFRISNAIYFLLTLFPRTFHSASMQQLQHNWLEYSGFWPPPRHVIRKIAYNLFENNSYLTNIYVCVCSAFTHTC